MLTTLNRSVVLSLTNKSGGALVQGDVVVVSTGTASAFTTTTTSGYATTLVGVILEPNGIANNAVGLVSFGGYVPKVNLSGSASLGDYVKTHTVAGQGVRHAGPQVQGDFACVLGTGTSPEAILFGCNPPASAAASGVAQTVNVQSGAVATGTTTIPADDTIPQNTEGTEFMTLAITPTSAANVLQISVVFVGSTHTASRTLAVALFQDTTANALAAAAVSFGSGDADFLKEVTFTYRMVAGTTSPTTFKVRAGVETSGTVTFNGSNGAGYYGGVLSSSITIQEVTP